MEFWGYEGKYYGVTAFGAFLLYTVLKNRGTPTILFLSHHLSERHQNSWGVKILEEIIFIAAGAVAGVLFVQPASLSQALTGGLAWTGALASKVEPAAKDKLAPSGAASPLELRMAEVERLLKEKLGVPAGAASAGAPPAGTAPPPEPVAASAEAPEPVTERFAFTPIFKVLGATRKPFAFLALLVAVLLAVLVSRVPFEETIGPVPIDFAFYVVGTLVLAVTVVIYFAASTRR